jgi:galactokinase
MPPVHGAERIGDSAYLTEVERYANAVAGLETEFLSLIETSSGEERFYLYWTYNHLTDSRVQVEYLRRQVELAMAAQSLSAEESIRTTLRDQAQFVRWQLGDAIDDLQQNIPEVRRLNQLWINEALRSLLSEVRTTVDRLWTDQCALMHCAVEP